MLKDTPVVTLRGNIKFIDDRSFKGADGQMIPLRYIYLEQTNCLVITEVMVKPADTKFTIGDLFDHEVEVKAIKDQKGRVKPSFIYIVPDLDKKLKK